MSSSTSGYIDSTVGDLFVLAAKSPVSLVVETVVCVGHCTYSGALIFVHSVCLSTKLVINVPSMNTGLPQWILCITVCSLRVL